MRVVGKFALVFVLLSYVVLAFVGCSAAREESARFERNAIIDLETLGAAVSVAAEATWETSDEAAARRVLDRVVAHRPDVQAALLPAGTTRPARVSAREDHRVVSGVFEIGSGEQSRGYVTLSRRLPDERELLWAHLASELLAALALTLLSGLLAGLVGASVIGRPLQRIVAQARRIGAGDLSVRLKSTGTDEIGELKRELNRMCDQLAEARRRLAEETAAKTQTQENLRHLDRLRTVGTLAAAFAHELGTPMNVLLLRAQGLATLEEASSEVRSAGEMMTRSVEAMTRTVRQMLDFARQERPRLEPVNATRLARAAVSLVAPLADRAGVSLAVEPEGDAVVQGDATQIEQALTNLIVNAIHATSPGGRVTVRIRRERDAAPPGSIGRSIDRAVGIEVVDTGSGLSRAELDRIFEPFYSRKAKGAGTGLGLSVATSIAEDHGGFLVASSEPSAGSCFAVWLPEAEPPAPREERAAPRGALVRTEGTTNPLEPREPAGSKP